MLGKMKDSRRRRKDIQMETREEAVIPWKSYLRVIVEGRLSLRAFLHTVMQNRPDSIPLIYLLTFKAFGELGS